MLPTFLLKECIGELIPVITQIINKSLTSGYVPESFKSAVITPLLKKSSLDIDNLTNYRPVSNLPFLSKVLEKVVSSRLLDYKVSNNLIESHQSAYRAGHSTETALISVQNDILREIDSGKCVMLCLLDLSAAFDTVSHSLLISQLKNSFGIGGSAIQWLQSYLENRTQSVRIGSNSSAPVALTCGVPQGSVLGPSLFLDYITPLASVIKSDGIHFHGYADDTQLYAAYKPGMDESSVLCRMEVCIANVRKWMNSNRLKLNDSKTEFIVFGTTHLLKKSSITSLRVGDHEIPVSTCVRNIGAFFDSEMNMKKQVNMMCRTAWMNINRLNRIKDYLSNDQLKIAMHAYVTSKLDSFNSLLSGCPQILLNKLQRVQNAAAKIITRRRRCDHITPILIELHWLPVKYRIQFKVLLFVFKSLHRNGPIYLKDLLVPHTTARVLRSSSQVHNLEVPHTKLKTYGDRTFSSFAPI